MILVIGGTTEGRRAAEVCDRASKPFYYSTRGDEQEIELKHGVRVSGGMTGREMASFCACHGVRLIVDAAHPFASGVHREVAASGVRAVRYERRYPVRTDDIVWVSDYAEASERLRTDGVTRLLALTGVQTIASLRPFWCDHPDTVFRILDRDSSRAKAGATGFPISQICYYESGESLTQLIGRLMPDAILTKESGLTGGFEEKAEAARVAGVKLYAIKRPQLPDCYCATVDGPHGLRRIIEKEVPEFFDLHTGLTTGTCATAAAKAALISFLMSEDVSTVSVTLPSGETIADIPVRVESPGSASVIKDGGSDPDVTHGATIRAEVALTDGHQVIRFIGGEGVGRVTLPGLGLEIGEPAINPVPRQMMCNELSALYPSGIDLTISVDHGRELAMKTFNPKVGVVGGISILGTSGIVSPYSHEAFVEALGREISVGLASGSQTIVLNSGAMSERYVKALHPALPEQAFVHYGNAVGDALKEASRLGAPAIAIAVMIGKASKLACGEMDTHSAVSGVDREALASIAVEAGCDDRLVDELRHISLARDIWNLRSYSATLFLEALAKSAFDNCLQLTGLSKFTLHLVSPEGRIITIN